MIGDSKYTYDENGNPTLREDTTTNSFRQMQWDEENRLTMLSDDGYTNRYTYNHSGERVIKSHGGSTGVFLNANPQGILYHDADNYTLYVSPYMVVSKDKFTKHYYSGTQRVASKIGVGDFNNLFIQGSTNITAGQKDYAERMKLMEQSRNDHYAELGIPPGPPTSKGIWGEPETTGKAHANTTLGVYDIPDNWPRAPIKNKPGDVPGPPVQYGPPIDPSKVEPGYGYSLPIPLTEDEIYYYHSDHLGSTSYVTDSQGAATQFVCYIPFGEAFVDEHTTRPGMPFKFNGKEQDEQTGLLYYGARYYDSKICVWYGVDPLAEKYPNMGGYVYCNGNPVMFVDPDGRTPIGAVVEGIGAFVITAGIDFLSNWVFTEGITYKQAFSNIAWGAAAFDGMTTAAISFFVDGTGSAKLLAKIGKSKGGKMALDIVKNMTVNIMMQIEKGADFEDINLSEEFLTATFSTLLSNGLGKKADELLESLKNSNKTLYAKLNKLQNNILKEKNEARIKSDTNKVKIATENSNNKALSYVKEKSKVKLVSDGTAETGKQLYDKATKD